MTFTKISSIDPADSATWEGRLFLTSDPHRAHDVAFGKAFDLVRASGLARGWFAALLGVA